MIMLSGPKSYRQIVYGACYLDQLHMAVIVLHGLTVRWAGGSPDHADSKVLLVVQTM